MSATRKGILSISCLVWGNFLLCKSTSNPSLSQITQQIHVNTQIIRCTHQTLSRKFIFSYLKMMFRNFFLHMILKIILTQHFFCRKFIFNKDFVILTRTFTFKTKQNTWNTEKYLNTLSIKWPSNLSIMKYSNHSHYSRQQHDTPAVVYKILTSFFWRQVVSCRSMLLPTKMLECG